MKDIKDWDGNIIPPVSFGEQAFIHQLTTLQRANVHMNAMAYPPSKPEVTDRRTVRPAVNIIIPVKGRTDHLKVSLASLNASIELLQDDAQELIAITVAEMDIVSLHRETAFKHADFYTYIESDMFNKSFLMNSAATSFATDVFLFYDVDLIVEKKFISELMAYAYTLLNTGKTSWILQPIYERKIFYVREDLTNQIFDGTVDISDLRDEKFMDDIYIQPTWYDGNHPPGGAVVVTKELFHTVGGYDPELFWGYSPEDRLFLQNCVALSDREFHVPNSPAIGRMYHLYHPNSETTNFMYEHMVALEQMIAAHPAARTCYLINKHILQNIPSGARWPDFMEFMGDATCWLDKGGLSVHGKTRLASFSKCKQKLIEMMSQWWCFLKGEPDRNTGHTILHLGYLDDAIMRDTRNVRKTIPRGV